MTERLEGFYFRQRVGGSLFVFMGDHAAVGGEWFTSHGYVFGREKESYPYDDAAYARLSREMAEFGGPVIIASHYALPGGLKPSELMGRLLPLPDSVKLVLHGHAHIGDLVWNKDNPWERNNLVNEQALRQ